MSTQGGRWSTCQCSLWTAPYCDLGILLPSASQTSDRIDWELPKIDRMHQNKMVRIALFFVLVNFSGRNCVTEADGSGICDDFRYDSTPSDFSGRNPVSFWLVQKRWLIFKTSFRPIRKIWDCGYEFGNGKWWNHEVMSLIILKFEI